MILEQSLWPGMTRQGFGYQTQVIVRPGDQAEFPVTRAGLWLPKVELAELSHDVAIRVIERLSGVEGAGYRNSIAAVAIRSVTVDQDNGCWTSDDIHQADHSDALWDIAELDMRGRPLDAKIGKKAIQVCDNDECLNARHFDFTHRVENRDRLLEPIAQLYDIQPDGTIVPVWELGENSPVILPTIKQSMDDLRSIQRQCVPYVDTPARSLLTANGVSKITINPLTGCWTTRTYYTRPDDFTKSFMFDGYGRLGFGPLRKAEGQPDGRYLAHRVMWDATGHTLEAGKVLNHECGFHPCCYPAHLTQMTTAENNQHARRMNTVIRTGALQVQLPIDE
jgi:hypothetical protein